MMIGQEISESPGPDARRDTLRAVLGLAVLADDWSDEKDPVVRSLIDGRVDSRVPPPIAARLTELMGRLGLLTC